MTTDPGDAVVPNNLTTDPGEDPVGSSSRDLLSVFAILISCVAVMTNMTIILISLTVSTIRKAIATVFLVSLCCVDLVAVLTLLGLTVFTLYYPTWEVSSEWCYTLGGIQEFCKTVSLLTVALMTFDKFTYIRYPLRHETLKSLRKACVCLLVIYGVGSVFALLPKFCQRKVTIKHSSYTFNTDWGSTHTEKSLTLFKSTFLFLLPCIEIAIIYVYLYRVTKRALMAVEPVPNPLMSRPTSNTSDTRQHTSVYFVGLHKQEPPISNSSPEPTTMTVDLDTNNKCTLQPNENSLQCACLSGTLFGLQHASRVPGTPVCRTLGTRPRIANNERMRWKAVVALTLPVCCFVVLWLPVNIIHISKAFDRSHDVNAAKPTHNTAEVVCFFLIHISYTINPIVYGFISKSFREESWEAIKNCFCDDNTVRQIINGPGEGSHEDFLQFLQRTSGSVKGEREKAKDSGCDSENILINTIP